MNYIIFLVYSVDSYFIVIKKKLKIFGDNISLRFYLNKDYLKCDKIYKKYRENIFKKIYIGM